VPLVAIAAARRWLRTLDSAMSARSTPPALATALVVFGFHTALALWIFVEVHMSRYEAQAGFAWFLLMGLDFPTTYVAWEYIAPTPVIRAVIEWGDGWGDGKNLRALVLHGVFGGAQWFAIGWLAALLLWPRTGLAAKWLAKRNLIG